MSPELINGLFALGSAVIGAVVGILGTLILSRSTQVKKEITFGFTPPSRLIEVNKEFSKKFEIRFDGKEIENAFYSEIAIVNTGNQPVLNFDTIFYGAGSGSILGVEANVLNDGASTASASAEISTPKDIKVSADFLNPGEEIICKIFVSGDLTDWTSEFRSPGVKVKTRRNLPQNFSDVVLITVLDELATNFVLRAVLRLTLPFYSSYERLKERTRESSRK